MPTKPKRTTRQNPQSVGNLAVADESLGIYLTPKAKTRSPQLCMVQDTTEDGIDSDPLAPAKGIMVSLVLSIMLWSLLVTSYWIYVGF